MEVVLLLNRFWNLYDRPIVHGAKHFCWRDRLEGDTVLSYTECNTMLVSRLLISRFSCLKVCKCQCLCLESDWSVKGKEELIVWLQEIESIKGESVLYEKVRNSQQHKIHLKNDYCNH